MIMRAIWTRLALGIATLALALASGAANADCDFLTGGGFIINNGANANFGVGGGCKNGTPTWGHLEYIDHGIGLKVHWTSITGYSREGSDTTDSQGRPIGTRFICGTARTNQPYGDVNFVVRARDAGEPGVMDEFDIQLTTPGATAPVYTTDPFFAPPHHQLNNGNGGGGNIQLHTPNPSTTGNFSDPLSCPGPLGTPS
jgi:hypothetical protein